MSVFNLPVAIQIAQKLAPLEKEALNILTGIINAGVFDGPTLSQFKPWVTEVQHVLQLFQALTGGAPLPAAP